jgi:hypothetical protein
VTPASAQHANAVCDFIAAIAALSAALVWFAAASHPVGIPGPSMYGGPTPEMKAHANKIKRGAILNRVAAALTGISALAQFTAWLIPKLSH